MPDTVDSKPDHSFVSHPAPFPRILCAIDGSRGSQVAADQAIALAGADGGITFIAVWDVSGAGPTRVSLLSERHARAALDAAWRQARQAGARAERVLVHADGAVDALLDATRAYDLLAFGTHPHSRAAGILLGDPASSLIHRTRISVLIARPEPIASGVIAATEARPVTRAALTAATHIAARAGAPLTLLHIETPDDAHRRNELEAELRNVRALYGGDVRLIVDAGDAGGGIVAAARRKRSGLVVLGSEHRSGLAALASVGERVAHEAPCSVLIRREPGSRY